jgi:hypothetical protein
VGVKAVLRIAYSNQKCSIEKNFLVFKWSETTTVGRVAKQ